VESDIIDEFVSMWRLRSGQRSSQHRQNCLFDTIDFYFTSIVFTSASWIFFLFRMRLLFDRCVECNISWEPYSLNGSRHSLAMTLSDANKFALFISSFCFYTLIVRNQTNWMKWWLRIMNRTHRKVSQWFIDLSGFCAYFTSGFFSASIKNRKEREREKESQQKA
jgi:hypothetical protein